MGKDRSGGWDLGTQICANTEEFFGPALVTWEVGKALVYHIGAVSGILRNQS